MVSCWPKMGPMNVAVGVVPLTDLYKEGQQTKYTAVEVSTWQSICRRQSDANLIMTGVVQRRNLY